MSVYVDNLAQKAENATRSKLFKGDHDWNFETEPQAAVAGRRIYTPRGKMLGGSSNMHAMVRTDGVRLQNDEGIRETGPGAYEPRPEETVRWVQPCAPWGEGPRFLIRDNDDTFGARFDEVAAGTGSEILRTPIQAPNANAFCERFLHSVRTACLDHVLILDEDHVASVLRRYCAYVNDARPHQGIAQKIPSGPPEPRPSSAPATLACDFPD